MEIDEEFINDVRACTFSKCLFIFYQYLFYMDSSQAKVWLEHLLMCLELILNSVNINLVTFSNIFDSRQLKGEIFSIFVIAIAAAEAAIGLAIVSSIHRNITENQFVSINQIC
uniref:NADH dehydrogenase subunit 4L n=1 Tax=Eulophia flava TaxID=1097197 RepID=A0A650GF73_9ASPA|nr:NADH dehydrogenase subunit 4L [Eulophia flava]